MAARCTAACTASWHSDRAITPSAPAFPCGSPRASWPRATRSMLEKLQLDQNEKDMLEHIVAPDGGRARPGPRGRHRRHAVRLHREGVRRDAWSSRARAASTRAAWRIDRLLTGTYHGHPVRSWPSWRSCSGSRSTWWGHGSAELLDAGHRRAHGRGERRARRRAAGERGVAVARDGRRVQRRGQRAELPAHHRDAVLLPVAFWRTAATWRAWRSSWTSCCARSGCPAARIVPMLDRLRLHGAGRSWRRARCQSSATAR